MTWVFDATHLDRRLDALEAVRAERVRRWSLGDLEIAEGRKLDGQVLERVGRLIDDQDV